MPKRIVGYTDGMSVRPGEQINFHVSFDPSIANYQADIVRMVSVDAQPGARIYPGSYVQVDR